MLAEGLLGEPPPEAQGEELAGVCPRDDAPDDALGLHADRGVVHRGEGRGDARVYRKELGLPLLDEVVVDSVLCGQLLDHGIDPVHGGDQLLGPELDLDHALGLEDATLAGGVGVALDLLGVDLGVDHDPRASAELTSRRDVHEDRVAVRPEVLDDEGPGLEDALEEVALASAEAAPVGHDEEGETLEVKLLHGVGGLEG